MTIFNELLVLFVLFAVWTGLFFVIIFGNSEKKHWFFQDITPKIPNALSNIRIVVIPSIFLLFVFEQNKTVGGSITITFVFGLCCMFDILDGAFARKWNCVSEWGKFLDPFADKVVTIWLMISACYYSTFPVWAFVIIFFRECYSIVQRFLMEKKHKDISAKMLGKIKTVVQFTVLFIYLLRAMKESCFLERIGKAIPEEFLLWSTILMVYLTVLSFLQFLDVFSYMAISQSISKTQLNSVVPSFFTWGNLLSGVTATFYALSLQESSEKYYVILFWLMTAALCDSIDGPIARKLNVLSDNGTAMDNIANLSTFGIATAVVVAVKLKSSSYDNLSLIVLAVTWVFFAVHFRLKRFTEGQKNSKEKKDFTGMPSPSGSLLIGCAIALTENKGIVFGFVMLSVVLMMSSFTYFNNKSLSRRFPLIFGIAVTTFLVTFMIALLSYVAPSQSIFKIQQTAVCTLLSVLLLYGIGSLFVRR